jgi:predicted nucleotidyltransferase
VSKQKDILPRVVEQLSKDNPGCGIILHGSVQRGYERPDSDIDLFVITKEGDSMRFDKEWVVDGVRVQVCYWPIDPLVKEMEKEPYLFYMLSHGRILSDPKGLAGKRQAFGKEYFASHPEVVELWQRQVAEVREVRMAGSYKDGQFQADPATYPNHLWWNQFAKHLRQTVR